MRVLVRAPIVLSFKSRITTALVYAVLAFWRATLLTAFLLVSNAFPRRTFGPFEPAFMFITKWLEFPHYVVGLVAPPFRWSLSQWTPGWYRGMGAIDPVSTLWLHMLRGVPVYLLLFALPAILRWLRARRLGSWHSTPPSSEEGRA